MARVIVSGSAGFIGSHICDRLLKDGHEVYGVDNLIGGDMENVHPKVNFCEADCANIPPNIFFGTEDVKFDLLYHCAATPHEGLSVFSPGTVTRNTYLSTVAMATFAINHGVKRFVNFSSMSRYGTGRVPFKESAIPKPVDPYGIAKLAAEKVLNILGEEGDMEVVHLVPHSVIGPRQKQDDPYRNVVAIMMNRMLQRKPPIIYGDGNQKRCFSFIHDAMDSIIRAGTQPNLDGMVFNIGPDDEFITINELVQRIAKAMGTPSLAPIHVADRPREVKEAYCSAAKARKDLGYKTNCTLDDGLKEMADWIKLRGPREFQYHLPIELAKADNLPKTWRERMF